MSTRSVKQWKIRLLKDAYESIRSRKEDMICFALNVSSGVRIRNIQGTSPVYEPVTLTKEYKNIKQALGELSDYIDLELSKEDPYCSDMDDWIISKFPQVSDYPSGIVRQCRLAWIQAMIVSIQTDTPVQGPDYIFIPKSKRGK